MKLRTRTVEKLGVIVGVRRLMMETALVSYTRRAELHKVYGSGTFLLADDSAVGE